MFQVTGAKLNKNVHEINSVGNGVDYQPIGTEHYLQILERLPCYYQPHVVQNAQVQNDQPDKHAVVIGANHEIVAFHDQIVQVEFEDRVGPRVYGMVEGHVGQ